MAEAKSIEKKPTFSAPGFADLKREGLELVQNLSGKTWTDYNLHDPGITILEQLCYALTEIIYQADFAVADLLAGENGAIDFQNLSLHAPETIFPSRPITIADYQKIIFDQVPEVDNLRLFPVSDGGPKGLYDILAVVNRDLDEADRRRIINKIKRVYSAHRNLCEDIAAVRIAESVDCELAATIESTGERLPDEILLEIYFKCAKYIASEVTVVAYEEQLKGGKSLAGLFEGPLIHCGFVQPETINRNHSTLNIDEISTVIKSIAGVAGIKDVFIVVDNQYYSEIIEINEPHKVLRLRIPETDAQIRVKITNSGRDYSFSAKSLKSKYNEAYFSHRLQRHAYQDIANLYQLPAGRYHNFRQYYSIQNQFPSVYGIGAEGLCGSDDADAGQKAEARAKAKQLKAYLLLFEQILADFLAGLENLPRLFSREASLQQSYFTQVLGNDQVPGADQLYRMKSAEIFAELTKIVKKFDNFPDRRNRFLDYLLALFGETFNRDYLRYGDADAGSDSSASIMIERKLALLADIVEIGRDRSGGFDYTEPTSEPNNISGLQHKINLLLGFDAFTDGAMASQADEPAIDARAAEGFHLLEHILLRPEGTPVHEGLDVPEDFYAFRISLIFPAWRKRFRNEEFRDFLAETVSAHCPAHIFPQFYWLDGAGMVVFENLYHDWSNQKCADAADIAAMNRHSRALIAFLLEHGSSYP